MIIEQDLRLLMEQNNISEKELDTVLCFAKRSGRIFRDPAEDVFYARTAIGRTTVWMKYRPEGEELRILDAYSHRMTIRNDSGKPQPQEGPEPQELYCYACRMPLENKPVMLHYAVYPFRVEAPCCPRCGQPFFSRQLVQERMAPLEQNLEDK